MKHVERRHFFIRECVDGHQLSVPYVNTSDNLADFFTKPLEPKDFFRFRNIIMNWPSAQAKSARASAPLPRVPRCDYVAALRRQRIGCAEPGDEVTLSHAVSRGITADPTCLTCGGTGVHKDGTTDCSACLVYAELESRAPVSGASRVAVHSHSSGAPSVHGGVSETECVTAIPRGVCACDSVHTPARSSQ